MRSPTSAKTVGSVAASATPSTSPTVVPNTAVSTDSSVIVVPQLQPPEADRPQQPDLAGPLDDGQRERVDDAEHRDDDRQPQQRVEDDEHAVHLGGEVGDELLAVHDRDHDVRADGLRQLAPQGRHVGAVGAR